MSEAILEQLQQYVANDLLRQPRRTIRSDEGLISSGLIDSMHLMDLALFVEDTFGVRIDDTELNRDTFDTLSQLAALVQSRL